MESKNSQQIRNFWMVGINYKKSDAAVRGLYAINNEQYDQLLTLAPNYNIKDVFIISTCNRTEIYGMVDSAEQLMNLVCSVTVGSKDTLSQFAYIKNEKEAMQHLFHVAAGLDSQILGDFEILGQIKNSVKFSKSRGFIGSILDRIINSVYSSAKSIKTNTALSGGTVSVSFAAVQCIREHFSELENKKILLYGTGKIGRATCRNLVDYLSTHNITLINRTEETAIELAKELNLKSAPVTLLNEEIAKADVILVSTGANEPVILQSHLEGLDHKLVIDLSVPCNVEVSAGELEHIRLVGVDMLSKIKDDTLQKRRSEIPKAIAIIEEHIAEFMEWYQMRKYVPVLKEVKDRLRDIYIAPSLLNFAHIPLPCEQEESIKKVVNSFAAKMKKCNSTGCFFIEAINDYIVLNG